MRTGGRPVSGQNTRDCNVSGAWNAAVRWAVRVGGAGRAGGCQHLPPSGHASCVRLAVLKQESRRRPDASDACVLAHRPARLQTAAFVHAICQRRVVLVAQALAGGAPAERVRATVLMPPAPPSCTGPSSCSDSPTGNGGRSRAPSPPSMPAGSLGIWRSDTGNFRVGHGPRRHTGGIQAQERHRQGAAARCQPRPPLCKAPRWPMHDGSVRAKLVRHSHGYAPASDGTSEVVLRGEQNRRSLSFRLQRLCALSSVQQLSLRPPANTIEPCFALEYVHCDNPDRYRCAVQTHWRGTNLRIRPVGITGMVRRACAPRQRPNPANLSCAGCGA